MLPAVPAVTQSHTRLPQVVQRIKAVEGQTCLLVVDKETDEELRRRQLTCTEEMARRGLPPAHDPWEPKPDWAQAGSLSSEATQEVRRALLTGATLASSAPPSRPPLPLWVPTPPLLTTHSAPWSHPFCPQPMVSARAAQQPGLGPRPIWALYPGMLIRAAVPGRTGYSDELPSPWPGG